MLYGAFGESVTKPVICFLMPTKNKNLRQSIFISLIWSKDCFTMSMADDSLGLDPLSVRTARHYGLMMRELEKALRGELKVDISPGQGTQLNFRIPLVYLQASAKSDQTLPIYPFAPLTCHLRRD
jgi:hypothetical protein